MAAPPIHVSTALILAMGLALAACPPGDSRLDDPQPPVGEFAPPPTTPTPDTAVLEVPFDTTARTDIGAVEDPDPPLSAP